MSNVSATSWREVAFYEIIMMSALYKANTRLGWIFIVLAL